MMLFFLGALLGLLLGGALCVRYVRREVTADIGPKLKHVQIQLDTIQSELTFANTTRHAELTASCGTSTTGKGPRAPGVGLSGSTAVPASSQKGAGHVHRRHTHIPLPC